MVKTAIRSIMAWRVFVNGDGSNNSLFQFYDSAIYLAPEPVKSDKVLPL